MDTRESRRRLRENNDPFERLEEIIGTFASLNREAGTLIERYIDGLLAHDSASRQ